MVSEDVAQRVNSLAKAQFVLAVFQSIVCAIVIVFAIVTKDNNPLDAKGVFSGFMGLLSSVLGVLGAIYKREFITRTYFVLQLWLLSTVTTYLYLMIDSNDTQSDVCSAGSGSFARKTDMCAQKLATRRGQLSLGVISLIVTFLTCSVSIDYEDALDGLNDELGDEKVADRQQQALDDLKLSMSMQYERDQQREAEGGPEQQQQQKAVVDDRDDVEEA